MKFIMKPPGDVRTALASWSICHSGLWTCPLASGCNTAAAHRYAALNVSAISITRRNGTPPPSLPMKPAASSTVIRGGVSSGGGNARQPVYCSPRFVTPSMLASRSRVSVSAMARMLSCQETQSSQMNLSGPNFFVLNEMMTPGEFGLGRIGQYPAVVANRPLGEIRFDDDREQSR